MRFLPFDGLLWTSIHYEFTRILGKTLSPQWLFQIKISNISTTPTPTQYTPVQQSNNSMFQVPIPVLAGKNSIPERNLRGKGLILDYIL